ncbi:MAG: hypothetical protein J7578_22405 [Chitinophagaceae bacterium]|nr:hypothetical protein [Chitinophagaceae bacterium]
MKSEKLMLLAVIIALGTAITALVLFQSPVNEDFVAPYLVHKYGFTHAIEWYLINMNGRFTTVPIYLLLCSNRFLLDNYAILLFSSLLISYYCIYRFVFSMGQHLMTNQPGRARALLIAAILFLTFLAIIPEVASFIYWMPAVITYTIPFCLFLIYLTVWANLFSQTRPWFHAFVICVITLLLGGCNEVMMYFSFVFPFAVILMLLLSGYRLPVPLLLIAIVAFVMVVIIFKMPGNNVRSGGFHQTQPLLVSVSGSVFRTWHFLLILFSNPVFYISGLGAMLLSANLNAGFLQWCNRKRTGWLLEFACLVGMIFLFDLILRHVANYVIPERGNNILICIFLLGTWWIIFMNAGKLQTFLSVVRNSQHKFGRIFSFLFVVVLLGSVFFRELVANILVAPAHHSVMEHQIHTVESERSKGARVVRINNYRTDIETAIRKRFGNKSRFVMAEFRFPPSFVFVEHERFNPQNAYFFAEYYGIDTLIIDSIRYPRGGLTNLLPD